MKQRTYGMGGSTYIRTPDNRPGGSGAWSIFLGLIRIIVGILFIFSGVVKANDPLGLSYKMEEFFHVLHLNFLSPAALTLSVIMIGFEILAGIALLLGFKMKIFGTLLLILMIIFTFLTAFAYLTGKIKECGCFGNCLPISAGASFWKDVILLILVLIIFTFRKRIKPFLGGFFTWFLMFMGLVFAFGLQWYTLKHLPLVDCLAYKVGNNIPQLMKIPPGATPDKYESVFIYEKDGEKKEFSADNIPWQDTTWQYVSRKDKLVQKGNAEPGIKDFVITDFEGQNLTRQILDHTGFTFLFMVKQVNQAREGWENKMHNLQADCQRFGIKLYGITASSDSDVARFRNVNDLTFPFLQMDATVIKTAARSNPCLILLKQGTIKGKWSYLDMPGGAVPDPDSSKLILKF